MPRRVRGLEATRLFESVAPRTYWCDHCRAPVVSGPRCPNCSHRVRLVYATQPRDLRPAYTRDVEETRKALAEAYGSRVVRRLMPYDGLYLLNKLQHYEAADELVSGGYVVGVRYYDTFKRRWRFRLSRYGAAIVLEESLPGYARSRRRLREGMVLGKEDLYELVEPNGDAEWVAVEDYYGVQGVAKLLPDGRLRVGSTWRRLRAPSKLRGRPFQDVVHVNRYALEEAEREAVEFLERELAERSGRAIATVSGGKDSTIAAYLAGLAGVREAVFVDTGLEHPETTGTAFKAAEKAGLQLHVLEAGDRFWRLVRVYGPPARDYRWCTRIVKLAVMARGLRELGVTRMVSITGQRAVESTTRAQAGRVAATGPPNPEGVMLAPIHYWSSLMEHLYIAFRSLPLHPLYTAGYERIGCFMCPTSRMPELLDFAERHPELWGRWQSVLEEWRRSHNLPREWIDYGLWRWRLQLPGDLRILLPRHGVDATVLSRALSTRASTVTVGGEWEVLLLDVEKVDTRRLAGLAKVLGYTSEERDGVLRLWKKDEKGELEVLVDERPGIRVVRGGRLALFDALCLVYMASTCSQGDCMLCTMICSRGAIRVDEAGPKVDTEKCSSCKKCVMICPATLRAKEALRQVESMLPRS